MLRFQFDTRRTMKNKTRDKCMEKQQKEFKKIMANYGYCIQIVASGNEQRCFYQLEVTTT